MQDIDAEILISQIQTQIQIFVMIVDWIGGIAGMCFENAVIAGSSICLNDLSDTICFHCIDIDCNIDAAYFSTMLVPVFAGFL